MAEESGKGGDDDYEKRLVRLLGGKLVSRIEPKEHTIAFHAC